MAAFSKTLTLLLSLAAAVPALAQETPAPAPATPAAPAADAAAPATTEAATDAAPDGIGQPYIKETFDDWSLRCIRTEDGADPCQMYQLLKDTSGNPVAEMTIVSLPEGSQAALGATIITPLETLLIEQLSLTIDTGKPAVYPFSFCTQMGCVVRIGFTVEEVERLRKGNKASIAITPLAKPDAKVTVDVSLKGFTKALEAQVTSEKELATKAAPAAAAAPAPAAPAATAPAEEEPHQ